MKLDFILTARFGNVLFEVEAAHHINAQYGIDVAFYALVNDKSQNPYAYKSIDFDGIQYGLCKTGFTDHIEKIESFDVFGRKPIVNLSNCPFDYISIESLQQHCSTVGIDELCIIGYFQNKNYIASIQPIIDVEDNGSTIGIHVRCGDYLKLSHIFPNLQSTDYFANALDYVRKTVNFLPHKPIVKVFSDEPSNVNLDMFAGYDVHVIANQSWLDDFYEFARCPYKIISNSTFAYQASILANSKLVCAPPVWNNVFLHSVHEICGKLYRDDFRVIPCRQQVEK